VSGNTLQQEKFKYLGVVFTSDGRWKEEIDTRIGKTNAVLRELYRPVVTKWVLSNTAKLSVFKSVFVSILTYGHESWVMTEKVLFQEQVPEMGFLPRFHGVTLRDKVRTREIRRALNVEPLLLRIERSQLRPRTKWSGYISNHAWSRLGVEPAEKYLKLLLTVRYFESSWGCCLRDPP